MKSYNYTLLLISLLTLQLTFSTDTINALLNKFNLYKEASAQDQQKIKDWFNTQFTTHTEKPDHRNLLFNSTESDRSYMILWKNNSVYEYNNETHQEKLLQTSITCTLQKYNDDSKSDNLITESHIFKNPQLPFEIDI